MPLRRAVFLDRDGTMARDVPYCSRPEDFELFPGVPEAIALINRSGLLAVVITNQSGIARGYFTEEALHRIHRKMLTELERYGARLDGIYYCPHHPDDGCDCRKPKTALFRRAAEELGIDLQNSFVVGDMPLDIEAGRAIGARTVLVTAAPSGQDSSIIRPDHVAGDLYHGVSWIIARTPGTVVRICSRETVE